MNCSKQLHTYLRFRRNGTPRDDAAFMAGINIAEALSTDAEEAAGRLADIDTKSPWAAGQSDLPASTDTQMPHLDTQQPTEPAAVATTIQRPETDVNAGQGTGRDAPAMDGSGSPSTAAENTPMARRAKPKDAGAPAVINVTHAKDTVRTAVTKILKYRNERKELNAAIGEERARVKNAGVPPAALDLAIRMKESDPEDRAKHDTGYLLARDALGLKVQADLFGDDDEKAEAPEKPAAKRTAAPDALSAAH